MESWHLVDIFRLCFSVSVNAFRLPLLLAHEHRWRSLSKISN
jgi:hypothetical protein